MFLRTLLCGFFLVALPARSAWDDEAADEPTWYQRLSAQEKNPVDPTDPVYEHYTTLSNCTPYAQADMIFDLLKRKYPASKFTLFNAGNMYYGLSFIFMFESEGTELVAKVRKFHSSHYLDDYYFCKSRCGKFPRYDNNRRTLLLYEREATFLERAQNELKKHRNNLPKLKAVHWMNLEARDPEPILIITKASEGNLRQTRNKFFGPNVPTTKLLKAWTQLTGTLAEIETVMQINHIDLKTQNIFVHREANGELTLQPGDWGAYSVPGQELLLFHTPDWASRESLTGNLSPKKDSVRALQLILLEMATGETVEKMRSGAFGTECLKQLQLVYSDNTFGFWYLENIPAPLRDKLDPTLLPLIEGSYPDVLSLHEAGKKTLTRTLRREKRNP